MLISSLINMMSTRQDLPSGPDRKYFDTKYHFIFTVTISTTVNMATRSVMNIVGTMTWKSVSSRSSFLIEEKGTTLIDPLHTQYNACLATIIMINTTYIDTNTKVNSF
jgi:hypothetical protein